MRAEKGRFQGTRSDKWSPEEEFILSILVGKASYSQIALRLGRRSSAVQRKASEMGLSARSEWAGDRKTRRKQVQALTEANLCLTEDDLAEFLPQVDEEPVLPANAWVKL